ncbi:ARP2/3 complex 16 kDa subunit (p16-Arc) [Ramicandelaber brevisporus]|nr:ARP2/3 complex 16 kDa subunit (p16-Arc) [Ramicandelaber brevisporus]
MSHRLINVDIDHDQEQAELLASLQAASLRDPADVHREITTRSAAIRQLLSRGNGADALVKALENPPYGRNIDILTKEAAATLVIDSLQAIRAQDAAGIAQKLSIEERDVLSKYLYHGLARPAQFNCAVLLMWHEKLVEAGGLGTLVRTMTDKNTL